MKRKSKKNNKRQSRMDLTKRLAGYSLTAGVVLASGVKAQADIIYSGPMDQSFGEDFGDYDLTMEGVNPEARFSGDSMGDDEIRVDGLNNNFQVRADNMDDEVYMLPASSMIGPNNTLDKQNYGIFYSHRVNFIYSTGIGTLTLNYVDGSWTQDGQSGYFGFDFDLENLSASGASAGTTVYGWGLLERIDPVNGRLLGWAYEDSGAEIHVGDTGAPVIPVPSALGLAALGAAGVLSSRRRKKA